MTEKRVDTMPGGFVVRGNGLFRSGGTQRIVKVQCCVECRCDTTCICPVLGVPKCSVCIHLQKRGPWEREPDTSPRFFSPNPETQKKVG